MGNLDFATVFKEIAKESDLQDIVKTYKNIIDQRAFTAVFKAAFEAVVEKKPAEEVNERCMEVIKDYIVPRGKMTLPEYASLLESLGNMFLKYVEKKSEHAEFDQSNKSNQMTQNSLSRFVDNNDGIITDTQTDLVWQKQDDGQKRTLEEAKAYCDDLSLGGHNDWRLPTINELKAMSSYWKQVFDDTKNDEPYWSNTVHKNPYPKATENQKYAAEVMFSSGATNQYFVIYHYYVRAVRNLSQIDKKAVDIKKCPNCGELIEEQFDECWKCSGEQVGENEKENNKIQSQKSKKKQLLKTVVVIICALIWWLVVLVKDPSNLGPGITLGHLLQASVMFVIAFVIVRRIWQKK